MAVWQCGGCGIWYGPLVHSCECQKYLRFQYITQDEDIAASLQTQRLPSTRCAVDHKGLPCPWDHA
jgi:hypothetical protein